MSFVTVLVNVERSITTEDAGGGEAISFNTIYTGLPVTVHYKDRTSVLRLETGAAGYSSWPGALTDSSRVVFLDPWDGTVVIHVNNRLRPNPGVGWLPAELSVIGVRPYPDEFGTGQLQLDVEDVG